MTNLQAEMDTLKTVSKYPQKKYIGFLEEAPSLDELAEEALN